MNSVKKHCFKAISVFFAILLAFDSLAFCITAAENEAEDSVVVTSDDGVTIEVLPTKLESVDTDEYLDWDSAVKNAREHIKNYETGFSVKFRLSNDEYTSFNMADVYFDMRNDIYKHTGNPDEGDFLRMEYQSTGIGIRASSDSKCYYIEFVFNGMMYFMNKEQGEELDKLEDELLEKLNLSKKTDYEKIEGVYDWICANVDYSTDAERADTSNLVKYTPYNAIKKGSSVCQGYATLFYRLMLKLGVDVRLIASDTHAWNIVCIDGVYYPIDCTWDANREKNNYRYFLIGEAEMSKINGHERDDMYLTTEFLRDYPFSLTAYGKEAVTSSNKCGSDSTWEIIGYELRIHGTGDMYDFTYMTLPWRNNLPDIKSVEIDEGITSVGEYAFAYTEDVTEITLPLSVTRIANNAFRNNEGIEKVTLSANIARIGDYAFYGCKNLKTVNFPGSLEIIGDYAFYRDVSLEGEIDLSFVKRIGEYAFYGCGKIRSVLLSEKLKKLSDSAFAYCGNLKTQKITVYVESIGNEAFRGCKISEIEFASECEKIGSLAFAGCSALKKLIFRGNMPSIAGDALKNVNAKVIYPEDNNSWSKAEQNGFGGNVVFEDAVLDSTVNITDDNPPSDNPMPYNPVPEKEEDEPEDPPIVIEVMLGDVNGDGKIRGNDATLLLKYFAGWDVVINERNSDCNGDGRLKGNDVTVLLKSLAGWNVTLGNKK